MPAHNDEDNAIEDEGHSQCMLNDGANGMQPRGGENSRSSSTFGSPSSGSRRLAEQLSFEQYQALQGN